VTDLVIHLPTPPSVNKLFANNPRGRHRTRQYNDWRFQAGLMLNRQAPSPVLSPCTIQIDLDDKTRGDAANREKAVTDLLVAHGVLKDDSKKYLRRVSIGFEPDVERDQCRVTIKTEVA